MAEGSPQNVVTGAFGYIGKYIARRLLALGEPVKTLTGHPQRENPFGRRVPAAPFDFDRPEELAKSLRGALTLYNTYWIRFCYKDVTFERAVANSRILIRAAEVAGVRRFVHISITNPSTRSPLPYFRGKAVVEEALRQSRLSYAIIRPTVVFGDEDILINNIAWLLRRFPVFLLPGRGEYRLQPVFVEDVAEMAVDAAHRDEHVVLDAVGPDVFEFRELVRRIAAGIGSGARILAAPRGLTRAIAWLIGLSTHDIVLTRDEIEGLAANLLVSDGPVTGRTRLSDWLERSADTLGSEYASELRRHFT